MTIPLFKSRDAKAVSAALRGAFPGHMCIVEDTYLTDLQAKGVAVVVPTSVYARIEADDARALARRMWEQVAGASSREVRIIVTDRHGTDHPYASFLHALNATLEAQPAAEPASSPVQPRPVMGADIRFWKDDTASVVFFDHDPDLSDEAKLQLLVHLVAHYYAKMMYNLSDCEPATHLRDYMGWAATRMIEAVRDTRADTSSGQMPLVSADTLPAGLALVPPTDSDPLLAYSATLVRKAGGGDSFATITECPEGAEAYYAPVSVVFLAHSIVCSPMPWWVVGGVGWALRKMTDEYSSNLGAWGTLLALEQVPSKAVASALREIGQA